MQSSTTRLAELLRLPLTVTPWVTFPLSLVVFLGPSFILLVSDLTHCAAHNLAELTEERGRVEKEASSALSLPALLWERG